MSEPHWTGSRFGLELDARHELRKRLVLLVDDHAFDGDAWRCGCGYSSGGTPLGVLRDHRRHVADEILAVVENPQVSADASTPLVSDVSVRSET